MERIIVSNGGAHRYNIDVRDSWSAVVKKNREPIDLDGLVTIKLERIPYRKKFTRVYSTFTFQNVIM